MNNIEVTLINQIHHTFEKLKIKSLMEQDGVTEIAINEPNVIFYEKNGVWECSIVENNNSDQLIEGLGTLLINFTKQNQQFNANYPMLSLTMPNNERVQLVRRPAAEHCSLTVRIPSKNQFSMEQYEKVGLFKEIVLSLNEISAEDKELKKYLAAGKYKIFLELAIQYRKNIVVSGATGSGKTTFMKH